MHVGLQVLESDVEHFYKQVLGGTIEGLSLIHISEPTRLLSTSYADFCLKKKKQQITDFQG